MRMNDLGPIDQYRCLRDPVLVMPTMPMTKCTIKLQLLQFQKPCLSQDETYRDK